MSSSSTSSSSSEMKALALKRDLNDMKNSMSELATMGRTQQSIGGDLKLSNSSTMSQLQQR